MMILVTSGVRVQGTALGYTDAFELRTTNDVLWWCASISKKLHKHPSNSSSVRLSHTERERCKPNLFDEVAQFIGVKVHVLVHAVHAWVATVGWETHLTVPGTAEELAEELVQVSEQEVLVRGLVIGRHVLHQRRSTTSIEEVDRAGFFIDIGREETSVEVGEKVDRLSIVCAGGKDAWHCDTGVGLRVVANDHGVDKQRQEGILVGWGIVLEQSCGVVVTDRGVGRSLPQDQAQIEKRDCKL